MVIKITVGKFAQDGVELLADLIQGLLDWMMSLGYWGIMIGLAIEVIPSELVLAYGGYLVSQGVVTTFEAVAFGTIGIMIAQYILYFLGLYGGRPFVNKFGKYLFMKPKTVDKAEDWFIRYGASIVFTARFVPGLRQVISIPAGMAKMSFWKFSFYTLLGTVPWCILFVELGKQLGERWQSVHEEAVMWIRGSLIAVVVIILFFAIWKWVQKHQQRGQTKGYVGEKTTATELNQLGKRYHVLNRRRFETRTGVQEIDHIIVGPNGLFHLETKHWVGKVKFLENGVERGPNGHHEDPITAINRHEFALKEFLRGHKRHADVIGILCFSHPDVELIGESLAFQTVKLANLVSLIEAYPTKHPLSDTEVKQLAGLLQQNSKPSDKA